MDDIDDIHFCFHSCIAHMRGLQLLSNSGNLKLDISLNIDDLIHHSREISLTSRHPSRLTSSKFCIGLLIVLIIPLP